MTNIYYHEEARDTLVEVYRDDQLIGRVRFDYFSAHAWPFRNLAGYELKRIP